MNVLPTLRARYGFSRAVVRQQQACIQSSQCSNACNVHAGQCGPRDHASVSCGPMERGLSTSRLVARRMRQHAIVALLALFAGFLFGCRPPAILGVDVAALRLDEYPRGTREIRLPLEDDSVLHGLFVPGSSDAPVVICLQAVGRSIAPQTEGEVYFSMAPLTRQLRGLGLASLVFDYRGVGLSTGSRSPDNLLGDARAIWDEALRNVSGASHRIVLRGTSMGSLAIACLLDAGMEPGCAVLVSPIRAETVTRNAGSAKVGALLMTLVSPFLRRIVDVDIVGVLAAARIPIVVVASPRDAFLPPDEQSMMRHALRDPGSWVEADSGTGLEVDPILAHVIIAGLNERIPSANEIRMYKELYALDRLTSSRVPAFLQAVPPERRPDLSDEEWERRLRHVATRFDADAAPLAAALAVSGPPREVDEYAAWLLNLHRAVVDGLSFESALRLISLEDPSGELRMDWLVQLSVLFSSYKEARSLETVIKLYHRWSGSDPEVTTADPPSISEKVLRWMLRRIKDGLASDPSLTDVDRKRLLLRILAKANGIPDRVSRVSSSVVELQMNGHWQSVEVRMER